MNVNELVKHKRIAIIGTDTEVGKTYVCVYLMNELKAQGISVAGLKPLASGAFIKEGRWVNEDALALQQASSASLTYDVVNPSLYQPAIAPHIAALQVKELLSVEKLVNQTHHSLRQVDADLVFIEGAGGLLTPLNHEETWADYLKALAIPIVLVVGMRLGCINHALLTAAYLEQYSFECIGWVANGIDPKMQVVQENIATLDKMLKMPRIATVDFDQQHSPKA